MSNYEDDDENHSIPRLERGYSDIQYSRSGAGIIKDLCTYDPTTSSSHFRLPHECYMIFVGRITSLEHFNKLTKMVHDQKSINSSFTMIETEEIEYFLEYITLNNDINIKELVDKRKHHFVCEDHFNPALFEMVERNASFEKLKNICRRYETRRDINIDKVMADHENRTSLSTPYFKRKGLSKDDAQAAAFALSFYTGTKSETVNRGASLVARQTNGQVIGKSTKDQMNEAAIILFYLVKALSYIPYYWGYVTRACQLTDDELKLYMPGCLITWIQFSSSKKGKKVATTYDFANRNTHFQIYSLTGRPIKDFSNFPDEDEVLFLPHTTFFVFKHEVTLHGTQHTIYIRQIETGLSEWSILWVDDNIFDEKWENKRHMERAAAKALNLNVHFIPKSSTTSALTFLRSTFGQRLKNNDGFRIVTDMYRANERPSDNAGARLIKKLRELGFKNHCLVFINNKEKAKQILKLELNSIELINVRVTNNSDDLTKFVNFEQYTEEYSFDDDASKSYTSYIPDNPEYYF